MAVPTSYRERVRALGPTIHPDMGKQAEGGVVVEAHRSPRGGRGALVGPARPDPAQASRGGARVYRYDAIDRSVLEDRSAEFRDQVARRLSGELTEDQFKPLRLMNGLYLQLHAYMLRIAIPYGALSAPSLKGAGRTSGGSTTRATATSPPAEPAVPLDQAGTGPRHPGRSGQGRPARHPDQRQLHPQHHLRPLRRRDGGGGRRSRGCGARRSASGRPCIPSSATCRASSRSR